MSRVLVTGATGFIGRRLADRLISLGADVTVVHRPTTPHSLLDDLRRKGASTVSYAEYPDLQGITRDANPEAIFHLAAQQPRNHSPEDIDPLLATNIDLGTHLLEGISGSSCVFVSTLSYFQYVGNQPAPFNLYSATKQAFSEITRFFQEERGVDARQVVLYDNFGPGDSRSKLIPQLLAGLRDHTPVHMGPSQQSINMLYIDDLVDGLIAASGEGSASMVAVRAGTSTTTGAVVSELERIAGREIQKTYDESLSINDREARSGPWPSPDGWHQQTTLARGLELTYASLFD